MTPRLIFQTFFKIKKKKKPVQFKKEDKQNFDLFFQLSVLTVDQIQEEWIFLGILTILFQTFLFEFCFNHFVSLKTRILVGIKTYG